MVNSHIILPKSTDSHNLNEFYKFPKFSPSPDEVYEFLHSSNKFYKVYKVLA